MTYFERQAFINKHGYDPEVETKITDWALWDETAGKKITSGSYQKCAGIKKIKQLESKIIKYKIKPNE